jgi:hypothetical protein
MHLFMDIKALLNSINQFVRLAQAEDNDDYLYHITFFRNLHSISQNGLSPGAGQLLGHGGNTGRSQGNIFMTDFSGIFHWYSKIEAMAEYHSDNLLEDEIVPVVLRTPKQDEDTADETAEQAGLYEEFKRSNIIEPEELEVFDGTQWIPIEDYDSIDISIALTKEEADEEESEEESYEEYGDKKYYYYFKDYNPLIPK